MTEIPRRRALRIACWMTLVGLVAFVWSVLDPTFVSVMIALSLGQAIGTFASVIFVAVVYLELRAARVLPGDDD